MPAPPELIAALRARRPLLWVNPRQPPAASALQQVQARKGLGLADVDAADALLHRWAPALQQLFPELAASDGLIESALLRVEDAAALTGTGAHGPAFIKADHALAVAGSIKARGGIFEALRHAQTLARQAGLLAADGDPRRLLGADGRAFFARHSIAVGSTGNLGMSIGIMASALGFQAVVHMSRDARDWKKALLRGHGVTVVEHTGDYAAAVAAGRRAAQQAARTHFVDDENSRDLFLGYAVAARRLQMQLAQRQVEVDARHPLVVYLPCGVGGAPGGITFGLKHVFGDAVHCWFAEPCASPAMLLRLASSDGPCSVYDIGLDNVTDADGLAVAQASEFVHDCIAPLVAGVFTVADDELFRALVRVQRATGERIEPSAAAAFAGPAMLAGLEHGPGVEALRQGRATQVFWTTGGALVPAEQYVQFHARGCALLQAPADGAAPEQKR